MGGKVISTFEGILGDMNDFLWKYVKIITKRIPEKDQVLPFFGLIAFLDFGWMLVHFFHKLPSWMLSQSGINIFFILCYSLAFCLVESLLVLLISVFIWMILPLGLITGSFKAHAGSSFLLVSIAQYASFQNSQSYLVIPLIWIAMVLLNVLIVRLIIIDWHLSSLIDRFTLFIYVYMPLGIMGFVVVVLRNLK